MAKLIICMTGEADVVTSAGSCGGVVEKELENEMRKIMNGMCENDSIDDNIGDQEVPNLNDKQEVKMADDQDIKNVKDEKGKNVEDQHGLIRSIGVAINSDVPDFGREVRDNGSLRVYELWKLSFMSHIETIMWFKKDSIYILERRLWDPGIKSAFQEDTLRIRWF
ncbi:hypothetical protein Tco_0905105 [Tanacetum coccineum]